MIMGYVALVWVSKLTARVCWMILVYAGFEGFPDVWNLVRITTVSRI